MILLILGSGSLARHCCYALADTPNGGGPISVHLAARSADDVSEIVAVARMRASLMCSSVTFEKHVTPWDATSLRGLLTDVRPAYVLNVASRVSPWDAAETSPRWQQLVDRAGFGITLPLQTSLVALVARAIAEALPQCRLINASYPDGVNPVLAALGFRICCGVGNVAIVAAAIEAVVEPAARIAVVAHHADLARLRSSDGAGIGIWIDDAAVPERALPFAPLLRSVRGPELNAVTGATIASLVRELASGDIFRTHVPGPNGLPGGYPVVFRDGMPALDLPDSLSVDEAVRMNQASARSEGVSVVDGYVRFSETASQALYDLAPDVPTAFPVDHVSVVAEQLEYLRS